MLASQKSWIDKGIKEIVYKADDKMCVKGRRSREGESKGVST